MTSKVPCANEKANWQKLMGELRATQSVINTLDKEVAGSIALMRSMARPPEEIEWATAIAIADNGEIVRSAYHQELALRYGLKGNTQSSRLNTLAAKRGDAVRKKLELEAKCESAEAAYRECLGNYDEQRMTLCGQPRTGHGHEDEPCHVRLGADGICQYHGAVAAAAVA